MPAAWLDNDSKRQQWKARTPQGAAWDTWPLRTSYPVAHGPVGGSQQLQNHSFRWSSSQTRTGRMMRTWWSGVLEACMAVGIKFVLVMFTIRGLLTLTVHATRVLMLVTLHLPHTSVS
jgi:hypothetical protein